MRRASFIFLWVLLIALLSACVGQPPIATSTSEAGSATPAPAEEGTSADDSALTGELVVFAAASLTEAFTQIATDFQAAHPDTTITYNFAGSQQLSQQLGQGAPADVFASANGAQMQVAIEAGRVVSGTQRTFVRNRLVVITPADNPAAINTLQDLAKPGIKLVLAAPEVPVGAYSLDFLGKASATVEYGETFSQTVVANVVSYEENVRSVLSKVVLGEADAGIVYTSDIALDASQVTRIDIPDELNTIAAYPIAPVSDSENPTLAQAFVDYILAPEGQTVLVSFGFIPTTGDTTGAAPGAVPVGVVGLVDNPASFSADDLGAMEQTTVKATDRDGIEQEYTGVLLSTLFAEVGVQPEATGVVFIGGDGFSQEVMLAELTADPAAIIVTDENGALRNLIPTMMPRYWVKGLVRIEIK